MHWCRWLLMVLVLSVTCDSTAQQVYKSIGPDGKAVYSDQPPESAKTKTTIISKPTAPTRGMAKTEVTRPPEAVGAAQDAAAVAKTEQRPKMSNNEALTALAANPAVENAFLEIITTEDLVRQTEEMCLRASPPSFKKYNTAAVNWRQRNAALTAQKQRILMKGFNSAQRRLVEADIKAANQQALSANSSVASKIKWCDQAVDEINKGEKDLHGKPNPLATLATHQPKPSYDARNALAGEPAVEKSLIAVMGMENLVQQTDLLCKKTRPTAFKTYDTAAVNWRQRNQQF